MSDPPAVKLTKAALEEMLAMDSPRYHPSSDRDRDRTRTRLKKAGLVRFKRSEWKWGITPAGRALLDALKDEGEGR